MSISCLPPVPPPIPPVDPPVPSEPKPNKATLAVVRYLAAMRADDLKAQGDALDDVIGICYKACTAYRSKAGNQLFLRDEWPEYSVQFGPAPEIEDDEPADLAADLLPSRRGRSRRENANYHRLRDWVQLYVLQRLAPYLDKPDEEIEATAADGKFRYLARRCVLAWRQKVARSIPKNGEFNRVSVSLNQVNASDEDYSLIESVVGPPLNNDYNFDPHALVWIVEEYRHEFDRLGVTGVLREMLRGLELKRGATTKNVAAILGVCDRQALKRIKRCHQVLKANRDRPAIKKLYEVLDRTGETGHYELAVEESKDTGFRRRVLSGAARDKWDGISVEGISELRAEEDALEPGDFTMRGDEVCRVGIQQSPERRASMVDALDDDRESYYEDGIEVDRYGDEVDRGIEEVDLDQE